jgi:uncharacterized protein (TIGR00255 family)
LSFRAFSGILPGSNGDASVIRSMTGFGRGEASSDGVRLAVEVKTVNHRYFSAALRLPREYGSLEQTLTAQLKGRVERGHAAVSFELLPEGGRDAEFGLNREVLLGYLGVLDELRAAAGPSAGVDLTQFLTLPGVVEKLAREPLPEARFLTLASRALDEALTRLVALREQEGARLAEDVRARLNEIEAAVERIVRLAPERERRERERLAAKLADLLGARDELGELRLAQEVALLADRLDIAEEVTRFRSHAALFRETLAGEAPAGRQLTFILQEMLREVNTMGAKANDSRIAQEVIAVKNELEKIREQAENIE